MEIPSKSIVDWPVIFPAAHRTYEVVLECGSKIVGVAI